MNAPPRMIVAPCAATKSTVSISWSRLSTEHGPAMTVSDPSPIDVSITRMTVSSGWNSRDTSLYGFEIGVTCATPGVASSRCLSCSPPLAQLAHDRDHGPARAGVLERRQALGEDQPLDAVDLGLGGPGSHDHEHVLCRSSLCRRAGSATKKQRSWTSALPARPATSRVRSLRERSCRAGKAIDGAHRSRDGSAGRSWRQCATASRTGSGDGLADACCYHPPAARRGRIEV